MGELSLPQLYSMLDADYSLGHPRALHAFALIPNVEAQGLGEVARVARVGFASRRLAEDFFEVTLSLKTRFTKGYLIARSGVWTLLVTPAMSSVVASQISSSWIEKLYPVLSRVYVEPDQILGLMDSLEETGERLDIVGYYVVERAKVSRKTWPRGRAYAREELEKDIHGSLLDSLRFRFEAGRTLVECWMSRGGHLVFYRGGQTGFSDFDRLVLQPYMEVGFANYTAFKGHERKMVEGEAVVKPFRIDPGRRLEKIDLQDVMLTLRQEYSASVLFGGNPWLLMSLIDRGDGSSFDLYAYEDEILVIPFNRASPESLTRLYSLVQAMFPSATRK